MMDILKKNMVSIICGVIAIVAVGALFYPVSGYYEDLQKRADDRRAVYQDLSNLATKQRSWPNVTLKDDATPVPLEMYPTAPVIARGNALIEQFKAEKDSMYQTLVSYSRHAQLVDGALPDAGPGAAGLFKRRYKEAVDMTVPENRANSPLVAMMKGGFAPTPDQITNAKNDLRAQVFRDGAIRDIRNPSIILNNEALEEEVKQKQARIGQTLREQVADSSLVYLYPNAPDQYLPLTSAPNNVNPSAAEVWAAQVSMWVQEDIAKAIRFANEGSRNVRESPVKLLQKMSVNAAGAFKPGGMASNVPPAGKPNPAADLNAIKNYRSSITGRVACDLYDIVPFNLSIVVDGTQVPLVLQSLTREKLITITTCSMESQDPAPLENQGYLLGSNPLVRLTIAGEVMLLREWTIPMMPPTIRRGLGLPETDAPK